ncbi:hypothetical protein Cfor_01479 [Coptotermes formosanus]|nr:hypothetical protein Cfor_01479 [Coptotermes formosanus]
MKVGSTGCVTSSGQLRMAAPLQTCTREERRSVIRFLSSEGVKPTEIRRRMKTQYGDPCLSLQQAYNWDSKFKNGMPSVAGADRAGRPRTACALERVQHAERVTRETRRVTTDALALELDISHGSAHHIVHDALQQHHKVCARRVPRQLTAELTERHMEACDERTKLKRVLFFSAQ